MQASIGKADRKMEDRNISVPDLSVSSFQAVHQARISPAKGRIQQARAKPPKATTRPPQGHHKATTRPPQGHILGIDSGVQTPPKATLKPHQGYPKATPRLHQGYTKATSKPHQGQFLASACRRPPRISAVLAAGCGHSVANSLPAAVRV